MPCARYQTGQSTIRSASHFSSRRPVRWRCSLPSTGHLDRNRTTMTIIARPCNNENDFWHIRRFLREIYPLHPVSPFARWVTWTSTRSKAGFLGEHSRQRNRKENAMETEHSTRTSSPPRSAARIWISLPLLHRGRSPFSVQYAMTMIALALPACWWELRLNTGGAGRARQ